MKYAIFDTATGRIRELGEQMHGDLTENILRDGEDIVTVDFTTETAATHFVVDFDLEIRPTIELNTPPAGTEVYVNHILAGVIEDGTFEFDVDVPGFYRIEMIPPFPYQTLMHTVVVHEV